MFWFSPPKFESLLASWLLTRGEEFPELKAAKATFGKHNCVAGPRESSSWEELRLGLPFRKNCEKDRRAEAEISLLESSASLCTWQCSFKDYKPVYIVKIIKIIFKSVRHRPI